MTRALGVRRILDRSATRHPRNATGARLTASESALQRSVITARRPIASGRAGRDGTSTSRARYDPSGSRVGHVLPAEAPVDTGWSEGRVGCPLRASRAAATPGGRARDQYTVRRPAGEQDSLVDRLCCKRSLRPRPKKTLVARKNGLSAPPNVSSRRGFWAWRPAPYQAHRRRDSLGFRALI